MKMGAKHPSFLFKRGKMFKFKSGIIGKKLTATTQQIDSRKTTNYAAALGDMNPVYMDDTRQKGTIAHPVFPVAVTWPLIQALPEKLSDDVPFDVISRMVHYSEHLEIHRPVKPIDKLTVEGKIAAVLSHRAGTVVVTRIDAVDNKGETVFTEYIGGMFRGVECEEEKGRESLPQNYVTGDVSKPLWSSKIHVNQSLPYVYDGCSDIVFPIHTSPAFATMVGLPGIILQGTCTLALAVTEIVNRELDGDSCAIKSIGCNFGAMVLPETDIQIETKQIEQKENSKIIYFRVLNNESKQSVKNGYVVV